AHVEVHVGDRAVAIYHGPQLVATHASPRAAYPGHRGRPFPRPVAAAFAGNRRRFPDRRVPAGDPRPQPARLRRRRRGGGAMSTELVHARVVDHLKRLRLGNLADRLDATLGEAARAQPTYIDFLDQLLRDEMAAKQRRRTEMGSRSRT